MLILAATYFVPRNESEAGVTYAVKQALGHSLGAAAFGSLLTGILHFIHGLFSVLAQSDDGVLGVCFCLVGDVAPREGFPLRMTAVGGAPIAGEPAQVVQQM